MFIKGKVAIVTGGASGIGLNIINELLKNDLKGVTIADVDTQKGQELFLSITKQYGQNRAIFVKLDVRSEEEFKGAFEETVNTFGNIDIVINCAGISDEPHMKRVIDINLTGVVTGTIMAMDEYLPKTKSSDNAVIINISSIYGLDGSECAPAYAAAKHGVIGIGKSLSTKRHYEITGVKVLTICPGFTKTPLCDNIEERVSPGRYTDLLKELTAELYFQPAEVVSKSIVNILEEGFDSGDVWLIEDDVCSLLEIPERKSLIKKKILKM